MLVAMVTMPIFPCVLGMWDNVHFGPIGPGKPIQSTNMQYNVNDLWMQQGNVLPTVTL